MFTCKTWKDKPRQSVNVVAAGVESALKSREQDKHPQLKDEEESDVGLMSTLIIPDPAFNDLPFPLQNWLNSPSCYTTYQHYIV